ncbi:DNA integrity scanning diadenylate cyclase DisA [Thermicanus aegyptius]|uniref:DNA integrity scanning diadenylate cyclase DisA n=1 Tax=Thermicanus aegyptius TaxID=94009 RepID=UPI0005878A77|nr:DNA integrity scanning diadenylate cyclase DisA [Thermicanus aegyptius]
MNQVLAMIAPGTELREGLENILRAKTGGLIVVGDTPEVLSLCDGGFNLQCDFSPSHIYELAKMDGAIVLSEDAKRIIYANTQLIPDSSIPSLETGTRHRTAERTAKQTGKLVIAISQRRNVITIYKGNLRYTLKEISVILAKANQALQTLEKYKAVLDQTLSNLSALEFEELVTLQEVAIVLQRIELVLRIKGEILRYIRELGVEGRLIQMQLEELVANVDEEAIMLIRDYIRETDQRKPEEILMAMKQLTSEEILDRLNILRVLGYSGNNTILDEPIQARGYRLLHRIPRLPMAIIQNLIVHFQSLTRIVSASIEELDEVEGIGEIRARAIKEGFKRIQQQVFLERHL